MDTPVIPIAAAQSRHKVRLRGTIQSVTYSPLGAPAQLIAVLSDGTGSIELRWPGRRDVTGINIGQTIEIEGTVMPAEDQLVVLFPVYRVLI